MAAKAEAVANLRVDMPFKNERISDYDANLFGLESIDSRFVVGGTGERTWTIDRERDTYLRLVARGREDSADISTWTLYRKRTLLIAKLALVGGGGDPGAHGWSHWRLLALKPAVVDRDGRKEIIEDLKEALAAYKDGGFYSRNTSYQVVFDDTECA